MIKPLEVFALNEQMARETGSIPYRSLRWVRRYHECGEFEIVVPANIYSSTWAYIYAYGRPETGIIQKVEFSDSSTVYGGIDSVTLSGFFLECILNRITFLVEQPDTQTIIHYMDKPKRPFYKKSQQPTVYQDPTGEYYITDGTGKVVSTEDGRTVSTNGLTEVHYNAAFGKDPDGDGDMECVYNYYTNSDKTQITAVNALGYKNTYDVVFTAPNGDVFYRGNTGTLTQAVGTVDTVGQTYFSKRRAYDAKNGIEYVEIVQVQGPWQRTGATDPITSGDSVELVYKWIRQMLGDWILYADTDVKGVQKTIDPTFQLLGDLAYSTLQEVGASLRIEYGFENDSYLLTIWRGADRSQEESSTEEPVSSKAAPAIYAMSPVARTMADVSIPTGYHPIEYVETSGTQWIDTGYRPDQDTHMSMDAEILDVYSGQTPPTTGKVGEMVEVAECGFASDGHVFTEWSTTPEGTGTSYAPGELYELTEGGGVLYARRSGGGEPPEPEPEPEPEPGPSPSVKKPWAVFSDTWGTISGYTATRDESAYKNTCYVLYDYDEPESFDDDGKPVYTSSKTIGNTITSVTSISVSIPYKRNRGFFTERVGDEDEPAIETYLDLRDEKPTCDNQWSREPQTEEYDEPITQDEANQKIEELAKKLYSTDDEGYTTDMKSVYDAFEQGLHGRGTQLLNEEYPVLTNLDTGTVNTDGYLKNWDLGDRVDFGVSTIGLRETGRIIKVEEVYESNGGSVDHSIHIEIGDSLLTRMKVK